MPTYKIKGERTLVEAWTYLVKASSEEEALEMVQDCPDGECEGIVRLDDDQCYQDETEFQVLEEVKQTKQKANVRKEKQPRKAVSQTTPASKKNNKVDEKRSPRKNKGSQSKRKKDTKYNKS